MHKGLSVKTRRHAVFVAILASLSVSVACAPPRGTIGAVLGQRGDGRLFVREVPPKLAADKAGLRPGDEILLIDGQDVRAMSDVAVDRALGGDPGSTVKLTVVRGEDVLRVTLTRTPATRLRTTRERRK